MADGSGEQKEFCDAFCELVESLHGHGCGVSYPAARGKEMNACGVSGQKRSTVGDRGSDRSDPQHGGESHSARTRQEDHPLPRDQEQDACVSQHGHNQPTPGGPLCQRGRLAPIHVAEGHDDESKEQEPTGDPDPATAGTRSDQRKALRIIALTRESVAPAASTFQWSWKKLMTWVSQCAHVFPRRWRT